jgi:hypothetical protein
MKRGIKKNFLDRTMSFLAVGGIPELQFQRFLCCSFYSVQLVFTSSGVPMAKSNSRDDNQKHMAQQAMPFAFPFWKKKRQLNCRQNHLGMHLQIYSPNIIRGQGQKGISDAAKG